MWFIGQLSEGKTKSWLHHQCFTSCFQILSGSLSAVVTYHSPQNRPQRGICVANHTSPIDVLILACDNPYALVSRVNELRSNCKPELLYTRILATKIKTLSCILYQGNANLEHLFVNDRWASLKAAFWVSFNRSCSRKPLVTFGSSEGRQKTGSQFAKGENVLTLLNRTTLCPVAHFSKYSCLSGFLYSMSRTGVWV
jgi:hypothetical protein